MVDVHVKYLEHFVELPGAVVVDVGCGDGALVRRLAEHKANPVGIGFDGAALDRARSLGKRSKRVRYEAGTPESLPLANGTADLVVFLFSFGQTPPDRHQATLVEARRVLRPGGRLHVVEPFAEGAYFDLIKLIDDPTERRTQTLHSISTAWGLGLKPLIAGSYIHVERFRDFEDFRARHAPGRTEVFAAKDRDLREAFNRLGIVGDDGTILFRQPCRLYHFSRVDSTEQAA